MTTLKRHGGWKSASVSEGYLEQSINNKAEKIHGVSGTEKSNQTISDKMVELTSSKGQVENFTVSTSSNCISFSFNVNVNVNKI